MKIPDGFDHHRTGKRIIVALPDCAEALTGVDPASLPEAGQGRGTIRRLELPGGGRLLLRQYQRGGALRAINKYRYLSPRRALDEIRTCRSGMSASSEHCRYLIN